MPRSKKNNFKSKGKNFHKNSIHKKKRDSKNDEPKSAFDKKRKNFKFIKRSKEAEDTQRRQKIIEDKYKKQNVVESMSEDDSDDNDDMNPFEKLIATFQNTDGKNDNGKLNAIESSSDSDAEDEVVEENNDTNDEDSIDEEIEEEHNQDDDEDLENIEEEEEDSIEDNDNVDDEDNVDEIASEESEADDEIESVDGSDALESDNDEKKTKNLKSQNLKELDPFSNHFENELSPEHIENLLATPPIIKMSFLCWQELGNLQIEISKAHDNDEIAEDKTNNTKKKLLLDDDENFAIEGENPIQIKSENLDLNKLQVKRKIVANIFDTIDKEVEKKSPLTPLQLELFSIFNNYQDLFYPYRKFTNAEEIRHIYCLHALNHILKTRAKILHHNAKLTTTKNKSIIPDSYRDQGLVRPKILIIVPFRDSAFRVVNNFISLLYGSKAESAKTDGSVINYKRFMDVYTGDSIRFPKTNPKPDDYEKTFSGNTDDTFRIGISFTKKCMKLYSEFYSSDIILASPLGLRIIVGGNGDKDRDYDFLNSIELLILDQAELFFAQNWSHFLHVLDHLHLQLQTVKNTDFSRVRSWCLNGFSKYYRQTLLFTSHELPEFRSIFNSRCNNYRGKVRVCNKINIGSIRNVITQVPQVFHKINSPSYQESFDIRFKYFITEILPQFKSPSMAHCMIYLPSYFDYVKLRNYLKSENINMVQICEYTKDGKIARARDMFFHSSAHFMLYSERAHFFRRTRIKGIRHLIMYQPPMWPHFYSEIINLMQDSYQNSRDGLETSMSITILYTNYDLLQISSIIGTERADQMLKSNKSTHMFTNSG